MEALLDLAAPRRARPRDLIEDVVPVEHAERGLCAADRSGGAAPARRARDRLRRHGRPSPRRPWSRCPRRPSGAAKQAIAAPVRVGLIGPGSFASRVLVPGLVAAGARLELVGGGSGPSAEAAARTLGFEPGRRERERGDRRRRRRRRRRDATRVPCGARPRGARGGQARVLREAARAHARGAGRRPPRSRGRAAAARRRLQPPLRAAPAASSRARRRRPVAASPPSYRVSAGELPDDHWPHDLEQGGGRLLGEGCHFVDSLAFVAGARVASVHAAGYGAPRARSRRGQRQRHADLRERLGRDARSTWRTARRVSRRSASRRSRRTRSAVLDDFVALELLGRTGRKR